MELLKYIFNTIKTISFIFVLLLIIAVVVLIKNDHLNERLIFSLQNLQNDKIVMSTSVDYDGDYNYTIVNNKRINSKSNKFSLKTESGTCYLSPEMIMYVNFDMVDGSLDLYTNKSVKIDLSTSVKLKNVEDKLTNSDYLFSKSKFSILNLDYVLETISMGDGSNYYIKMTNGDEIKVSREIYNEVKKNIPIN